MEKTKKTLQALRDLATIFVMMIERDKKIEIRKKVLAEMPEFNAYLCFKRLSEHDPLGYWTPEAIHAFVKKNTGYIVTSLPEVTGFLHSLNFERPKLSY